MSPRGNFIRVRNWEHYQHYTDRRPPWIKLHGSLLDDPDLMALRPSFRWLAVSLLLLAAKTSNRIPINLQWLADESHLSTETVKKGVDSLLQTRFVERTGRKQSASTPQAESYPSRARTHSASSSISEGLGEGVQGEGADAQALVAHFVDHARSLGAEPPRRMVGQVAREVGKLVLEVDVRFVNRAVELLAEKGLNPATLSSLAYEAQVEGKKRNGRGLSAAEIRDLPPEFFEETT